MKVENKVRVHIPSPCHKDWEEMLPVQEGRFCGNCNKVVIDFTQMSEDELKTWFSKDKPADTCGHFWADQAGEQPKVNPILRLLFQTFRYAAVSMLAFFSVNQARANEGGSYNIPEDQTVPALSSGNVNIGVHPEPFGIRKYTSWKIPHHTHHKKRRRVVGKF